MVQIEVKINGINTIVDAHKLEKLDNGLFANNYNEGGSIDILTEANEKLELEKREKLNEANSYLSQTDWIEAYKLRHDLGLEIIPKDSSKWEVINKREEYKLFLKGGN